MNIEVVEKKPIPPLPEKIIVELSPTEFAIMVSCLGMQNIDEVCRAHKSYCNGSRVTLEPTTITGRVHAAMYMAAKEKLNKI